MDHLAVVRFVNNGRATGIKGVESGARGYIRARLAEVNGVGIVGSFESAATDGGDPKVGGKITFTGLVLYYSAYSEKGAADKESEEEPNEDVGNYDEWGNALNPQKASLKEKKKGQLTLIKPAEWGVEKTNRTSGDADGNKQKKKDSGSAAAGGFLG